MFIASFGAMASRKCFGRCLTIAIILYYVANNDGFIVLKHIQSGKYLDYSGYAAMKCSSRRFQVFRETLVGYDWLSLREYKGQSNFSLTVLGCNVNATVKMEPTKPKGSNKDQLFRLYKDGEITTPCGAGFRLTLEEGTGRQYLDRYFVNHKVRNDTEQFKFKIINCDGDPEQYIYAPKFN